MYNDKTIIRVQPAANLSADDVISFWLGAFTNPADPANATDLHDIELTVKLVEQTA